jgi:hypothetical protein
MATVLWRDVQTGALDRCRLETGPSGLRLSGVVLTAAHGTPLDVRYLVEADLTVTPATNTLPIRRLAALEVGQAADLEMAWVQFPGLEVLGSAQRYERLAADRWRFSTGEFEAELLVDGDGLVLDYGGLFRSLAYRAD